MCSAAYVGEFTYVMCVCFTNYVSCYDIASKVMFVVPAFVSFISLKEGAGDG